MMFEILSHLYIHNFVRYAPWVKMNDYKSCLRLYKHIYENYKDLLEL